MILKSALTVVFALSLAACGDNITFGPTSRGGTSVGNAVTGSIDGSTGRTTLPGRSSSIEVPAETWTVSLNAGETVTLLMCRTSGSSFDPYISMHGPGGRTDNARTDDDGAGFPNSRLIYTPTSSGTHTIYASTFTYSSTRNGTYQLTVYPGSMGTVRCP